MAPEQRTIELLEPPAPFLKRCCGKYVHTQDGYLPTTRVHVDDLDRKPDNLNEASFDRRNVVEVEYNGTSRRAVGYDNGTVSLEGKPCCCCGSLVRTPGKRHQAADCWWFFTEALCLAGAIAAGVLSHFHAEWESNILWLAYICVLELLLLFAAALEINRRNAWVTLTEWMHTYLNIFSTLFFLVAGVSFALVTLSDKNEDCYNKYCRCEQDDGTWGLGTCGIRKNDLEALRASGPSEFCEAEFQRFPVEQRSPLAQLTQANRNELDAREDGELRPGVPVTFDGAEWLATGLDGDDVTIRDGGLCFGEAGSEHEAPCAAARGQEACAAAAEGNCMWDQLPVPTSFMCADSPCRHELYRNVKLGVCASNAVPVLDPDELGMRYVTRSMWLISLLLFVCVLVASWEKFKYLTAFNPIPHSLIYLIFPLWIVMTICRSLVPPKDEHKARKLKESRGDERAGGGQPAEMHAVQPRFSRVGSRKALPFHRDDGPTSNMLYKDMKVVPDSMAEYDWSWHKYQNLSTIFSYMSLWILLGMVFMVFIGALLVAYIADAGRALTPSADEADAGGNKALVGILVYVAIANFIGINPVAPGSFIDILGGFMLTMIVAGSYDWARNSPFASWAFSFVVVIVIHFISSCLQYWMGKIPAIRNWMNKVMPPPLAASSDTVLQDAGWFKVGIIGQLFMDTMNGLNQGRMDMDFCTQFWSEYSSFPNAVGLVTFGWIIVVDSVYTNVDGLDWTSQALPLVVMIALAWQMIASAWAFKEMLSTLSSSEYGLQLVKWKACQTFIQLGYRPTKVGWENDVFDLGYRCLQEDPKELSSDEDQREKHGADGTPRGEGTPGKDVSVEVKEERSHSQPVDIGEPDEQAARAQKIPLRDSNDEKENSMERRHDNGKNAQTGLWSSAILPRKDYNERIYWLQHHQDRLVSHRDRGAGQEDGHHPLAGSGCCGRGSKSSDKEQDLDAPGKVVSSSHRDLEINQKGWTPGKTHLKLPAKCTFEGKDRTIVRVQANGKEVVLEFLYTSAEFKQLFDNIDESRMPIAASLAKKSLDDKEDRAVYDHCKERIMYIEDQLRDKDSTMNDYVVKSEKYEVTKNAFSLLSEWAGEQEDVEWTDCMVSGDGQARTEAEMELESNRPVTVTYDDVERVAFRIEQTDFGKVVTLKPAGGCCGSSICRNQVCHYMRWVDLLHFLAIALMFVSGGLVYFNLIKSKMDIQNAVECGSLVVPTYGPYAKSCRASAESDQQGRCATLSDEARCQDDMDCTWGLGGNWVNCATKEVWVEDAPIGWSSFIIYCLVTTLYYLTEIWDNLKSATLGTWSILTCQVCSGCCSKDEGDHRSPETAFTIEDWKLKKWVEETAEMHNPRARGPDAQLNEGSDHRLWRGTPTELSVLVVGAGGDAKDSPLQTGAPDPEQPELGADGVNNEAGSATTVNTTGSE